LACGGEDYEGKTVIRYARWGNPEELGSEKRLVQQFEAENPDIKVKTEFSSWGDYWSKLQSNLASGTAPDVFMLTGAFAHEYQVRGQLENLDPWAENDPDVSFDDYYQVSVQTYRFRGGFWAIPRDCNTGAIVYNKTLFDRYKVPYPKDDWKWDDLREKARQLTVDENDDGRLESYGFLATYGSMEVQYGPFIWQNGGDVLNEDRTVCLLDQPAAVEAMEFLHGMVKDKVSPNASQAAAVGGNLFLTGRLAMQQAGSWTMATNSEIDHFEWDIAPMPAGPAGSIACVNGLGAAVYAKSKNKEAAWRFAKFFGSRAYQEALAKSGTSIPVLRSVAQSEVYLDGKPPGKKYFLQQLENAHPLDFLPGFPKVDNAIRDELELVWLGRKEVREALADATKKVNVILEDCHKTIRDAEARQKAAESARQEE
jgi:multiple sugar transport system substrate-binding protein